MNNILWGDTATERGKEIYIYSGSADILNSDIEGGDWSNINIGNFDIHPCFCDTSCNLMESSPCIGLGRSSYTFNNVTYHAPAFDFNGNPRPNGVDSLVDIGAIESSHPCKVHPISFSSSIDPPTFLHPTVDTMIINCDFYNPNSHGLQVFSRLMSRDSTFIDSLEMYDDGNHHDGSANDGLYGTVWGPFMEENEFEKIGISITDQQTNDHFTFKHLNPFTTSGPVVFSEFLQQAVTPMWPGYRAWVVFALKNEGLTKTVENIEAEFTTNDSSIFSLANRWRSFGNISPEATVYSNEPLIFYVQGTPQIDTLRFHLDIYSNGHLFWQDSTDIIVGIKDIITPLMVSFDLKQNYPNPFNPSTVISWQLAVGGPVKLSIYDLLGKEVAVLVNEKQAAGFHQIEFDATGMGSGIYIYRLVTDRFVQTRKMVLMR